MLYTRHTFVRQSEWVSSSLLGDKSFQAITCTGADNTKQMREIYRKHEVNKKLGLGKKNTQKS